MEHRVDVILPCLDEAAALPWIMDRLPRRYRAIVVDNGSSDGSDLIAAELGALVVHEARRGYGAAVQAGLAAATADLVVIMDCDATIDPVELPALVAVLLDDPAELVCGRRRPVDRGSWPLHSRIANAVLAALLSLGGRVRLHDLAPVRVAWRRPLLGLAITDGRYGYPLQTLLRAGRAGWRVVERDVSYRSRPDGSRSKITGTLRGTVAVATDMLRVARAEARPVVAHGGAAAARRDGVAR
ncbi:glycosyltransferase family 2 protein [Microlunatus sp. GCM10028923]|uniref:glycosyltransferase family 2 protein n=1 Tax=Microlunatus sp. GCM10028923 TaxID=3273400 RepID=UPI003616594D